MSILWRRERLLGDHGQSVRGRAQGEAKRRRAGAAHARTKRVPAAANGHEAMTHAYLDHILTLDFVGYHGVLFGFFGD